MIRLDGLPQIISGVFNAAKAEKISNAPGCVGVYAMTEFSIGGEPRVAWVSDFGVEVTNGYTWQRISTDVDWENTVSVANLSSAVLSWDQENAALILDYPSSSASNDRTAYIHMSPEHRKENGQPKWTLPHTTSVADRSSAVISGVHRMYEADWSDGKVYLRQGQTGTVTIQTPRSYFNRDLVEVSRAALYHTNFGASETCTVTWTTGRDSASTTNAAPAKTVALNGQAYTDFWVGRAGDWHEVTISYTGGQSGAFGSIDIRGQQQGPSGKVL